MNDYIWLIGCGYMGRAYAEVLKAKNLPFKVIGNSEKSASIFEKEMSLEVIRGSIANALTHLPAPKIAIIATNIPTLSNIAIDLIKSGVKRILIEKPGFLNFNEFEQLLKYQKKFQVEISIGYNRRFFSSTLKLLELINSEGGIKSLKFEFTELTHIIKDLSFPKEVKQSWLVANSSHVIDLAFYLIGLPKKDNWKAYFSGNLPWHPSSCRFHGAGISINNIPFSYYADWECPGRWSLDVMTIKNRYILKPMEKLQKYKLGSTILENVFIDDSLDIKYKPGIYRQCSNFIENNLSFFPSLKDQGESMKVYYAIAGYKL